MTPPTAGPEITTADAASLLARQCHAIDEADFAAYGASFSSNAVFRNEAIGATLEGRTAIAASARRHREARDAQRARFRHYMFGTLLEPSAEPGQVVATSTTLIIRSCAERTELLAALTCRDVLLSTPSGVVVSDRLVRPIRSSACQNEE